VAGLHVREAGAGPPIVFLHGWTCHGGFFADQMAALADSFLVLAPDLPGHGASAAPARQLSIEGAAEAVGELLRDRDLRGVTLIGWSMGAHVAFSLLVGDTEGRVARLVVVDMSPKVLNDAAWRLGIRSGLDAARSARAVAAMRRDWRGYAPHIAANMFAEGAAPGPWQAYAEAEIAKNDGAVMALLWESLAAQDFRDFLPRLAVPTAIAYGGKSRIYAEDVARYQAAVIPDARLVPFARSGHSPFLEEGPAFTEMVRALCRCP